MLLGELIKRLEVLPADKIVSNGFGKPRSYRGYYEDLAFEPMPTAKIGNMLSHAKSAVGQTFYGYKGGEYTMDLLTECWIAEYGSTVDYPIHPLEVKAWEEEEEE